MFVRFIKKNSLNFRSLFCIDFIEQSKCFQVVLFIEPSTKSTQTVNSVPQLFRTAQLFSAHDVIHMFYRAFKSTFNCQNVIKYDNLGKAKVLGHGMFHSRFLTFHGVKENQQ